MRCSPCVWSMLLIFAIFTESIDCFRSHCNDVTTSPKYDNCPPTIDLIVLILSYDSSGAYEFRDILSRILAPCNAAREKNGAPLSNITFITNVQPGAYVTETHSFTGLPHDGDHYATFPPDGDGEHDIPGAIKYTVSARKDVMSTADYNYTPAVYILTHVTCKDLTEHYHTTMKILKDPNTTREIRNLDLPVRLLITKGDESETDNVTACRFEEFTNLSSGYFDYKLSVSSTDPSIEEKYGFCSYSHLTWPPTTTLSTTPTTTTALPQTSRMLPKSKASTIGTTMKTTTTNSAIVSETGDGTSGTDEHTTTTPAARPPYSPGPQSTTQKPPPSAKVIAGVAGGFGALFVAIVLVCMIHGLKRRCCPTTWELIVLQKLGRNISEYTSTKLGTEHNSYAEPPSHKINREKEPNNDVWEVVPSQLLITEQRLGSGAYAVVHKAVLTGVPPVYKKFPALQLANILPDTENVIAAKTPKKHASIEERLEFLHEVEFMKRLDYYPHLLSMIGCSSSVQYPVLLTEYCALGDLLHLVRALDGSSDAPQINVSDLIPICWQMSDALAYLAARKIIHRDVAARNVLVTKDKMAKLSDFGLCRTDEQMMYTTRGGKLPIKWMAPESLDYAVFSAKTDVWSYGILYEVFSFGKTPFVTVDADILAKHLQEGNRLIIPEGTPPVVSDLMRECWMERPEDRPDVTVIRETLYSMMEAESDGYGYLTFSKNYYDMFKKELHNIDEVYEV